MLQDLETARALGLAEPNRGSEPTAGCQRELQLHLLTIGINISKEEYAENNLQLNYATDDASEWRMRW